MAMNISADLVYPHWGIDLAFQHHKTKSRKRGSTGKPFARYWLHAEPCACRREKCRSRREVTHAAYLFSMTYKPRLWLLLLLSVPDRKQLNFTFDAGSRRPFPVERLRNFADRLKRGKFPAVKHAGWRAHCKAAEEFDAGLSYT